jgi:SAM-dependent methyltransferase
VGPHEPTNKAKGPAVPQGALDAQQPHWETVFSRKPEMLGESPSDPARWAAALFRQEGATNLLDLGCGQGRDTLFFVRSGFQVTAVDYSQVAVETILSKSRAVAGTASVAALRHDLREPLPFPDVSFDGCYCHMLFCMAFTTPQLERLFREVRRVLKPGAPSIYTVRHTRDPWYGTGIHRGEDLYEVNGFIVHFFNREKVEHLAKGYTIVGVDEFEEGELPRKLFRVTLRKEP